MGKSGAEEKKVLGWSSSKDKDIVLLQEALGFQARTVWGTVDISFFFSF